jgi:predicted murein hydrolase (TIGR00659 family)
MKPQIAELWVYLAATPLLGLTATLIAYQIGYALHQRAGLNPVVNPVVIAVLLLIALLLATGTSYATYFSGAQFVHFLLGPATVALAVPLYEQRAVVKRLALPLSIMLVVAVVTAIVSAVGLAWLLGVSRESLLSLAPKSVTTPVAMGISERIGGIPTLTAVLVILTGMTGAMLARPVLLALGVTDERVRGFTVGAAAHGIGTARAFQVSETMGAFAGLAMGLSALLTAFLAPLLLRIPH